MILLAKRSPRRRIVRAGALLLAALTAGCAGENAEQLFVKPGAFDYMSCPELVSAAKSAEQREQNFTTLIARAEKDSFGVFMAEPAYRGELLKAQGEKKNVAEVFARKNCPPDTPAAPPQPKTGAKPKPKAH
jgi:hypothetical protein